MIPTNFGGNTGRTQDDLSDRRKQLAYAMLQQGMDTGPVQSPWQGAARLVQALMGGLAIRRQEQQAGVGEPGNDNFPPLPDNPPIPGERPLYPDPAAAEGGPREPAAPAAQPGAGLFAQLPDNSPVPTPKPYRDPLVTTDYRQEQPMASEQPGDDAFAPLPGNPPIPTPRPYREPQGTTGHRRGSAAQPVDSALYGNFMRTVKTKVSNPFGLAAIASTGQAESSFSPKRANGSWSDPSQSGKQGTSGGIMSWRDARLQNLYSFAAARGEQPGAISPQTQAEFFLQEDPRLVARLNAARSVEEAQRLMNNAWRFAGYDQPGGEAARRTEQANGFLQQFLVEGAGDPLAPPANPPFPTPRPYRDPPVTTDYRREQPMAADQPDDDIFAPLPDNGAIPSLRPGYRAPEITTDERRQQPAAPAAGGGGAGSANDGGELKTILSDPARRAELPAGMRNNNPTNLKYVGQRRPGIIGPSENTDQGDPQVVYATPEAGMEHNVWQIMRKYRQGMLTSNQIIAGKSGWTPDSFTAAANIARSMGIGPDDDIRLDDPVMAKKFVRALVAAVNDWRTRERFYKSWSKAAAAAPAYGDMRLTAFRIERSRRLIGQEKSYVQPPADLLPAMDIPAGRFVDFGGSAGELCAVLREQFPAWSFTVVETKSMADAAQGLRPGISFSDQLPPEFDLFYSSGTLQYLSDPENRWREALSRTTRYAYLARNSFSHRKLFTVQSSRLFDNGTGPVPEGFENVAIRYPHQTICEASLSRIADEMGFDLAARFEGRNSGVTGARADVYGADLLFKRR